MGWMTKVHHYTRPSTIRLSVLQLVERAAIKLETFYTMWRRSW